MNFEWQRQRKIQLQNLDSFFNKNDRTPFATMTDYSALNGFNLLKMCLLRIEKKRKKKKARTICIVLSVALEKFSPTFR